jgi:hypothetical protein
MLDALQPYPDFERMMEEFGKREWLEELPSKDIQKYFLNWYDVICLYYFNHCF